MILVWRDHVRFTYYYTYNINIYAARIDGSTYLSVLANGVIDGFHTLQDV